MKKRYVTFFFPFVEHLIALLLLFVATSSSAFAFYYNLNAFWRAPGSTSCSDAQVLGPISIAANADDGNIYNTTTFDNGTGGAWIGRWGGDLEWAYFDFTLPQAIPAGSTLAWAVLEIPGASDAGSSMDLKVWARKSANAPAVTGVGASPGNSVSAPVGLTTAAVTWPMTDWRVSEQNPTPDIKTTLQELVDTYGGLASGSHVQLWVTSAIDPISNQDVSFNTKDSGAPLLATLTLALQGAGPICPPAQLAVTTAPQTLATTWACSGALTLQAQNGSSQAVSLNVPLDITLGGTNLVYFSDTSCANPITSTQIPALGSAKTIYFAGAASGSLSATFNASGVSQASQTETISAIAPFTWIGGASCDGTWADSDCWQGGSVPGSTHTAYFDSNCTINCTASLGANTTIAGLAIYGGTLNLGSKTLTLSTGALTVRGGTLHVGTGTLSVQKGGVYFHGGTIHLSGTLAVAGDYLNLGGTLNTAGGTLQFNDLAAGFNTWTVTPGAVIYNNVSFVDNSNYFKTRTISGTMTVGGTLTLGGVINSSHSLRNGTIAAKGNVVIQDNGYTISNSTPTTILISGSTAQLIDASTSSTGYLPALTLASTGGAGNPVTFKGTSTVAADFTYTSGTLDFTTHGATLNFNDPAPGFNTWTVTPGTVIYNNVSFTDTNNYFKARTINGTMTVGGTLTLGGVTSSSHSLREGTIAAKGNVVIQNNGYTISNSTPTTILISGSTAQLIDASTSSTGYLPSLTLASTGGAGNPVTFKGTPAVSANFTYTSGTLDFTTHGATLKFSDPATNYYTWTITPGTVTYGNVSFADNNNYIKTRTLSGTMSVGGTLTLAGALGNHVLNGGTIAASGDVSFQNTGSSGTTQLSFTGTSPATLTVGGSASVLRGNVTVSKSGATLTLANAVSFNAAGQNLNLTAGTIDMSDHALTVAGTLTMTAGTVINEGASCTQGGSGLVCTGSGFTSSKSTYLQCNSCVGCTGTATITCP